MQIEFAGEAGESFQSVLDELEGYGVEIVTLDGEETDAILIGPDRDSEWYDAVKFIPVNSEAGDSYDVDDYPESAIRSARVKYIGVS